MADDAFTSVNRSTVPSRFPAAGKDIRLVVFSFASVRYRRYHGIAVAAGPLNLGAACMSTTEAE
jgi:hypothetical protein